MPVIRWNGGLEVDVKTVISILGFTFACGGFYYKLNAIEQRLTDHLRVSEARVIQHDQMIMTVETLIKRMDACCPLAAKPGEPSR